MHVITLHAEMDDAQPEAVLALAQRLFHGAEAAATPEAGTASRDPHRDMGRRPPRLFSREVRHAWAGSLRLPACAFALPAPATEPHRQLLHVRPLPPSVHRPR